MLSEQTIKQLQALCITSPHRELCGVITHDDSVIQIKNVSKQSSNHFLFDKREWLTLLNQKVKIKALWHTHPKSSTEPSEADLNFIRNSKHNMLIVSENDWRYLVWQEL